MRIHRIPILPLHHTFIGQRHKLNYKAICIFSATGFFLDQDTYYQDQKVLKPGFEYELDENQQNIISEKSYFKWYYQPIDRSLKQIANEFAELFESIIQEQTVGKTVILPLSGGLDSRTQAAALFHLGAKVNAYSYSFEGGLDETYFALEIAKACKFPVQAWKVPNGYLWDKIDQLARINQCYSEFTHPRQMAFINNYSSMGDIFSLGHWGDVLFDNMGVDEEMPLESQTTFLISKIVKKGGMELAQDLWQLWNLEGNFKDYLYERIKSLLIDIDIIVSANAQIRAFKSMYWAPRWTSVNLSVFESQRPISLPYYDNKLCEFICTVPEKYLAGRQIQIEYLKMRMPALAKIIWQDHRPFNLYNYHWDKFPYNIPFRIGNKIKRQLIEKNFIQRNWELQFLGRNNLTHFKENLESLQQDNNFIPKQIIAKYWSKFNNEDALQNAHPISMLLTFSKFSQIHLK